MERRGKRILGVCSVLAAIVMGDAAEAQDAASHAAVSDTDIIVTARKRDETSLAVPVVITAVGQAELERRGINSLDAISRLVPQLISAEGGGTVQGGVIALRGVAGADANPFADQAVSFNIDGVQVARTSIRRAGQMDMAQVEVLKGPQALFFGKNSPGGVISIRTADPTPSFSAKASVGYEVEAQEWRGDAYIAGPITDTLGFRIAAYGDHMRGWSRNVVPKSELLATPYDYVPKNREYAVRGTLKFEPSDGFSARLKITYNHVTGSGSAQNQQFVSCPGPTPTGNPYDNCKADDKTTGAVIGTSFNALGAPFGDGVPYLHQKQFLAGLEMNAHLSDQVVLTSVTGVYDVRTQILENYSYSINPSLAVPSLNLFSLREISEEVRLASSFDGPLNFLVGGHYQDSNATNGAVTYFNALNPGFINNYYLIQKGQAWSIFGQATVDFSSTFQLSAGGRYSEERKRLPYLEQATVALAPRTSITTVTNRGKWDNFSPEVTIRWQPSARLTTFASYKKGFLSGGFNSGATNLTTDLKYDQQTIEGFEGGLKASLLNGALRTNLSVYRYIVKGLQVTTVPAPAVRLITNAGKMTTEGAEFDFNYRMPMWGMSFHGALAYNRARYNIFTANCYRGQTFATGCSAGVPNGSGFYSLQNLAGQQVLRAPDWSGNGGFNMEQQVGDGLKLGLSGDVTYSSSYSANSINAPGTRQPSYALFDSTLRLFDADERWEFAVIGRNLTNKFYFSRALETAFTGTPANSATPRLADISSVVSRGREVMLRISYRFD